MKKKLSRRESKSRNLKKQCRKQKISKRLQMRAKKRRNQKSKSNSLSKLTKNLPLRMKDPFGKG